MAQLLSSFEFISVSSNFIHAWSAGISIVREPEDKIKLDIHPMESNSRNPEKSKHAAIFAIGIIAFGMLFGILPGVLAGDR